MATNKYLRDLQDKLYAKQDAMARVFSEAKKSDGTFDFTQAQAFEHLDGNKACIEMLEQMEKEVDDLQNEVKTLEGIQEQEKRVEERLKSRRQVDQVMIHPSPSNGNGQLYIEKTLGQLVAEKYPRDLDRQGMGSVPLFDHYFKDFNFKTLMTTTANGFPPESTRISRITEFAHRPIQITDLFPVGTTDQPQIIFMRETVSTNTTREVGEGLDMTASVSTEAVLTFAPVTVNVRKLVVHIPATEEQLADVQQVSSLIDARLRFFLQQKLDSQLMVGLSSGIEITGILNSSPQSMARGTDPIPDAIYKGMVLCRVTGRATPGAVVMHPNDLADLRLLRSADGFYIWGHPSIPGPMTVFGVPIVEADVMTENTTVLGDFANHSQLWVRQGIEVATGYRTDDFVKGIQTIRATMRAALTIYRPAAFVAITGM